ncbi:Agamous-like MADS-box protein AGL3 [Bienertia sinuspersici]
MGRAKTTLKFIEKEKKRNSAYLKKKETLIKKAYELSVLCNVPICLIIYPFDNESKNKIKPQVYSFHGETRTLPVKDYSDPASDPNTARELVYRYLAYPEEVRNSDKKSKKLSDVIGDQKMVNADDNQELSFNTDISAFRVDQLIELLGYLDYKLDLVRHKIAIIKGFTVTTIMMGDNVCNQTFEFDQQQQIQAQVSNELQPLDFGGAYDMNFVGPTCYNQGPGFADHMALQCLPMNAMIPDFSFPMFYP